MEAVFLKLLNLGINASYLTLAVIMLRLLLRKAPKNLRCILWGLVALRLVLPFSLESVLSLIPSAEPVPQEILLAPTPAIQSGIPAVNHAINPILSQSLSPMPGDSVNPMQIIVFAASIVWIAGVAAMLFYMLASYLRLRKTVREAVILQGNVLLCDKVATPFLLGLLRPRIYLPSSMEETDMQYVLLHENAHLKRGDHIWKLLGFLLLAIYWFHPILWAAYFLFCRDIELACDEKVLKSCGSAIKKPYSEALLHCSATDKTIAACPLAFGLTGVKARIKNVLHYKKPSFWIVLFAVILSASAAVCLLTVPVTNPDSSQNRLYFDDGKIYINNNILQNTSKPPFQFPDFPEISQLPAQNQIIYDDVSQDTMQSYLTSMEEQGFTIQQAEGGAFIFRDNCMIFIKRSYSSTVGKYRTQFTYYLKRSSASQNGLSPEEASAILDQNVPCRFAPMEISPTGFYDQTGGQLFIQPIYYYDLFSEGTLIEDAAYYIDAVFFVTPQSAKQLYTYIPSIATADIDENGINEVYILNNGGRLDLPNYTLTAFENGSPKYKDIYLPKELPDFGTKFYSLIFQENDGRLYIQAVAEDENHLFEIAVENDRLVLYENSELLEYSDRHADFFNESNITSHKSAHTYKMLLPQQEVDATRFQGFQPISTSTDTLPSVDLDNNGIDETYFIYMDPRAPYTSHLIYAIVVEENGVPKYMQNLALTNEMHYYFDMIDGKLFLLGLEKQEPNFIGCILPAKVCEISIEDDMLFVLPPSIS